jgi:hypothetical protein
VIAVAPPFAPALVVVPAAAALLPPSDALGRHVCPPLAPPDPDPPPVVLSHPARASAAIDTIDHDFDPATSLIMARANQYECMVGACCQVA